MLDEDGVTSQVAMGDGRVTGMEVTGGCNTGTALVTTPVVISLLGHKDHFYAATKWTYNQVFWLSSACFSVLLCVLMCMCVSVGAS